MTTTYPEPTNMSRAARARTIIEWAQFNKYIDPGDLFDGGMGAPLVDTIANVLHLASSLGMDPDAIVATAEGHYRAETGTAGTPDWPGTDGT